MRGLRTKLGSYEVKKIGEKKKKIDRLRKEKKAVPE